MLSLRQLFDHESSTYTYVLGDTDAKQAVLIDPVLDEVPKYEKLLAELGWELVYALDTHVHADHVTGAGRLRDRLGCKTANAASAEVPCTDVPLADGQALSFGKFKIEARATPGHTAHCLTYVLQDEDQYYAFTGDTLLIRGCGRTDFQEGDSKTLYSSVHEKIFSLPDSTVIYPAHDYKGYTSSTVAEEKAHNPRLGGGKTVAEFAQIMSELNLSNPKLMDVAVPLNLRCGLKGDVAERGFRELTPSEVGDVSSYRIIDVRGEGEFEGEHGHIEGAELVPLPNLEKECGTWAKDEPILLVCRSGRRSREAASQLSMLGFDKLTNLEGGMLAWNEQRSR